MGSFLVSLPEEVLLLVSSRCDYATALALSLTCTDLRHLRPQSYGMTDLLQIERWPCYDFAGQAEDHLKQPLTGLDYFACSLCLRLRSAAKFSNAMMKGKRGKHSRNINNSPQGGLRRFCIDCGIKYGRYQAGAIFEFGGVRVSHLDREYGGGDGLVCRQCHSFSRLTQDDRRRASLCTACSP